MFSPESPREQELDALLSDALALVREWLRMDIAYTTEVTESEQVIEIVAGESRSFNFEPGARFPLADTYCQRMLAGEIDHLVPDTSDNDCVAQLEATIGSSIGAYVGVPIVLPGNGRVYGTLCCISHEPKPDLGERDLRFVRMVARLVANEVERDRGGAMRVNERIVQQLTLAVYSLEQEDLAEGRARVSEALGSARELATELIGQPAPGDLRA